MDRRAFLMAAGGPVLAQVERFPGARQVEVMNQRGFVDLKICGRLLAVYNYDSTQAAIYRPFFFPLMGPNGKPITQNGEFPGSLRGHYWHRSLFVAHQKVNGISFWEERQADCGRMIHLRFTRTASGAEGRLVEELAWRDLANQDLVHEIRTLSIPASPSNLRVLDLGLRLRAAKDLTFDRTPYNLLACRVIDAMCLVSTKQEYTRRFGHLVDFSPLHEGGIIRNSEGKENDACRGERARWCDFSGPLGDGTHGGVALLDHPANPRHPTPWHNWNNMTITASLTYHEPLVLREGRELALTYRVLVHAGDALQADVAAEWKRFAQTEPRA